MEIKYKFPNKAFEAADINDLLDKVKSYFTSEKFDPTFAICGDYVTVTFPDNKLTQAEKELQRLRNLCEKRHFEEATIRLTDFVKEYPFYSEAFRILAQIYHEQKQVDDAIALCEEALKCDPTNIWAILLMGNIYNVDKKDLDTAMSYYNTILEYHSDNAIAINNLASIYYQNGNKEEAIKLFEKVIDLCPNYENAYYGLGNIYYDSHKFKKSFELALTGCIKGEHRNENKQVSEMIRKLMLASAQAVIEGYDYYGVYRGIKDVIEERYHASIRTEENEKLSVYAQLQYGPTHGKEYHNLIYNPKRPYIPHLMVHELMHLDMIMEANTQGIGAKLVYSTNDNTAKFHSAFSFFEKKLIDRIGYTKAINALEHIMKGLVLQLMNCPLDLFVEQRIYNKYEVMRPIQLLSLLAQEEENIRAIKGSEKVNLLPPKIVRASKIMNLVTSLHFEKLYGISRVQEYRPTKIELDIARDLYDEFLAYEDYKPGEEYDLINHFAAVLELDDFVTLTKEADFLQMRNVSKENYTATSEKRYNSSGLTKEQQARQDKFYETHKDGDGTITAMMSMYMLGALEFFKGKPMDFIRKVAFEIAAIGVKGISPEDKYVVNSIDGKPMGGYQTLAYYYVSWKLFNPDMHKTLQLPFDSAWETALDLYKRKFS